MFLQVEVANQQGRGGRGAGQGRGPGGAAGRDGTGGERGMGVAPGRDRDRDGYGGVHRGAGSGLYSNSYGGGRDSFGGVYAGAAGYDGGMGGYDGVFGGTGGYPSYSQPFLSTAMAAVLLPCGNIGYMPVAVPAGVVAAAAAPSGGPIRRAAMPHAVQPTPDHTCDGGSSRRHSGRYLPY